MSSSLLLQLRYKDTHLKEKGQQVGLRCVEDDPKMVHSLAASKLQSNLEYKRQSKEERSQYKIHADQPEFLQAKRNQAQASDVAYRHKLHDYTCDPEQLNVKHAKQAYKLQSDVSLLGVETLLLIVRDPDGSGAQCNPSKHRTSITNAKIPVDYQLVTAKDRI